MYVIIFYIWVFVINHPAEVQLEYKYIGPDARKQCELDRKKITPRAVADAYLELAKKFGPRLKYLDGVCALDYKDEV